MKRYSPSSTLSYQRCPRKWLLERTLRPVTIDKASTSAWIGSGVALAMEHFHKDQIRDRVTAPGSYAEIASQEAGRLKMEELEKGGVVTLGFESEFDLVEERAARAAQFLCGKQPLRPDFQTLAAELQFPSWGNARIDLVVDSLDGIMVVDYKTAVTCTKYMLDKKEREYETSLQLYLYAMALRSEGRHVDAVGIAHCTIEPKPRLDLWTYALDENLMEEYARACTDIWARMERTEREQSAPMAFQHSDQFGICKFYELCVLGFDDQYRQK